MDEMAEECKSVLRGLGRVVHDLKVTKQIQLLLGHVFHELFGVPVHFPVKLSLGNRLVIPNLFFGGRTGE